MALPPQPHHSCCGYDDDDDDNDELEEKTATHTAATFIKLTYVHKTEAGMQQTPGLSMPRASLTREGGCCILYVFCTYSAGLGILSGLSCSLSMQWSKKKNRTVC